jgi:CSLREA domain-containing protein
MRKGRKFFTLAVIFCALAARAGAADFTVQRTFDDETDATPGDGVCASVNGVCTLRAAVQEEWKEPDTCDLNADGIYQADDRMFW